MAEKTYHHGDLERELRLVAADVITERGAAGFSLREVARRAGVSHAAPAHHFGDATGLLTAVAIDGLNHLHDTVAEAAEGIADPRERLTAMARAYVTVSVAHPGHCAVAFRHDLLNDDDADYIEAADLAHAGFFATVAEIAEMTDDGFDVGIATGLGWAAMQGLVEIYSNMTAIGSRHGQNPPPPIGEVAELFSEIIVRGLTTPSTG